MLQTMLQHQVGLLLQICDTTKFSVLLSYCCNSFIFWKSKVF